MKKVIYIQPISDFIYTSTKKERYEVEYYSDGTNAVVAAVYYMNK